jgi:hypothetical protein
MNVTPSKLEANRRNARNSTGPKTLHGKAASKMNALKHGVLAESVVVRGHKIKESARAFKKLCHEFFASHAPAGPLEEMLVEQIVTVAWRLRRARRAESGEIALSVDTGWSGRDKHNPLTTILNMPSTIFSDPLVMQLERSALGCHYLLFVLRGLRKDVERDGELTEASLKDFKTALRDHPDAMVRKLDGFHVWFMSNPEKLEPDALRTRHKDEVLKFLDRQIRNIEYMEERRDEQEKVEEQSRQAAAVLPSEATLDKILRYETSLERQLYRAMNHLERLQRRRQGENIPAPVTMEISSRAG